MKRKINPMVDIVFKAIFGAEERKAVLMDFLNCIFTKLGLPCVTEVSLENPYSGRERLDDKEIILDVKVRDETGRFIQVEMQSDPYSQMTKRMVYNNATITYKTLKKGDNYNRVGEVISIWVLGKDMDDREGGLDLIEWQSSLGRADFDLQKIIIAESGKLSRNDDRVGKWMYIINRWEEYVLDNPPKWVVQDERFQEVFRVMDEFSMSDEEFDIYLGRLNYQMDVALREQSGFDRGLEEGKKEGLKEGVKQGQLSGQAKMLLLLLHKKFDYPQDDPSGIINRLNSDNIESASIKLMEAVSVEDFISSIESLLDR